MNIILAGMPGCGKSTVALMLAARLGFGYADTDEIIAGRYGKITEIFKERGEEYFRSLERIVVEEVSRMDNNVIATGGGCLLSRENVERLKSCGCVIYLKTGVVELTERLKGDNTRPLLMCGGSENIKRLYEARKKIYESAADIIVVTDGKNPKEIVEEIAEKIK